MKTGQRQQRDERGKPANQQREQRGKPSNQQRGKPSSQQRGKPANQQQPEEPDHELDSYLAALAPEEDVETTGTGRRFGSSQVYQLRLPLMANEQLKELAARRGTSPGALARDWVMQHLAQEPDPGQAASGQAGQPSPAMRTHTDGGTPAWPQQEAGSQFGGDPRGGMGQFGHSTEETDTEITIPRGPLR